MNYIVLSVLLVSFPLLVTAWNDYRYWRLIQRRLHDQLLYSLCAIRDDTALLSIKKGLPETSAAFHLFYTITAAMIHHHRESGPCFHRLVKRLDDEIRAKTAKASTDSGDEFNKKLEVQLSVSSDELKHIASRFNSTLSKIIEHAQPYICAERWTEITTKEIKRVSGSITRGVKGFDQTAHPQLAFA